ncbi:hypothetical protein RIF29_13206 [Crotalaria pallida]|uniref:Glycosyltransferase n=1 Tax=Crotalaria pallida TaxID=3830 RepID=A0AAN9INZ7_CROPI
MKDNIVLYPSVGRGHLFSMVELGKLILTHDPSFSITILIPTPPNTTPISPTTTTFGFHSSSSITFHHFPTSSPTTTTTPLPPHLLILELIRPNNHNLHQALQSISKTSNLKAIVLDFLNYTATQVTAALDIPTFFYYTSGASTICCLLHQPTLPPNPEKGDPLLIPGFPNTSAEELPNNSPELQAIFRDVGLTMSECDGIIVNTFEAIEGRAVKALEEGLCLPEGATNPLPPVFCIGPVISMPSGENDENGCLSWLDSQPSQSVVLLSFGSLGRFSKTQLKEIAIGLEKSEQRFLWVVRSRSDSENEERLEELLPEGFLERTKEKGMVVRNWAPQAAILSHESVGGFVTHCGWNSVLEAVCEGVPMVTWPLYAEQKLNRAVLVKEMKVALALKESEDGFVSAIELGERIKELMESEKGKELRQRVLSMKVSAVEARKEGGSSYAALNRLTKLWKKEDHFMLHSPNTPLVQLF